MAFVMAFQTVEQLAALGQGGPGVSSNLVLYYIYQRIPERLNWGYVNAMTVILLAVLMIFTVSNLVFFERGGRESDRE
jgi:multiple sugar transport system permease protein